jgi:hypothetical protein
MWLMIPVVLVLAAAAAELAARWWVRNRTGYYVLPPGMRLRLRPDPDVFPQLEPSVWFLVNRDGERGDEVPRGPGPVCRMLVLGGSQPEGYLLDQFTCWPGALHRLLQVPENLRKLGVPRVHVGSIARSGVGSEALDLILERVLPRYPRLDTIVILVGASDVLRWLEVGAPPSPPPPVQLSEVFRWHPEMAFGWRPRALALAELGRRLRLRWLRPIDVHDCACRWIGRARAMRARAKETRTAMPDPSAMLAHFEAHFTSAITKARARADRVLVVRQPWFEGPWTKEQAAHMWHGGAGKAWQEEVTSFYSLDVLSRLMSLLDEKAATIARGLGVEQIDVMPAVGSSLETYYDFFHATPAGAREVAAAVAAAILRQGPAKSEGPVSLVGVESRRQKVS